MAAHRFSTAYAFNSGELSPLMGSRQDQAKYAYGAKRMRNFIPALQGPARKRPGFIFGTDVGGKAWFVPFIFSQRDAWVLIFRNSKLRFFTDHGDVVEAAKTATAITKASPGVVTSNSHGFSNGDEVVADISGMTDLDGRNFIVAGVTTNTFTLVDLWGVAVDTTAFSTFTSGTFSRVYQIATPYALTDITDANTGCCLLAYAQTGNAVYLCVPGFATRKLLRSGPTSWAFSTLDQTAGPFESIDPDQTITVYSGAETGTGQTLTASSAIFKAGHVGALFLLQRKLTEVVTSWEVGKAISANDVRRSQGHYYKALNSATTGTITPSHTEGSRYDGDSAGSVGVNWDYLHSGYGWAKITAVAGDGLSATVDILSRIPSGATGSGNASTQWAFGSWSTDLGYPTAITFFRERLCMARDTKIWGSVPSDFENFAERDAGLVTPDSAFSIDIRSGVNDAIQWIVTSSDLLVGTEGTEFAVGEIATTEALGPTNIAAKAGPGYGSRSVRPVNVNDAVMYVLPSGRVMRELRFAFETDGYVALNRTAFAEHIAKGQIIQLAFENDPESIVWSNCLNGDLIGMSIEREQDLLAWHKHPLGGAGLAQSVCVIPSPDGTRRELCALVKRTINAQTKYYLEYSAAHWDEDTDAAEDMIYTDSNLTYSGAATSILTNAHHLEGATVQVLGNARDLGDFVVSNGSVDLGNASVTKAQLGLGYEAILETMNMVRPGFLARIIAGWVRFLSTVSAGWSSVTQRERSSETSPVRPVEFGNISVSAVAPPVTRLVKAPSEGGHAREVSWVITHDRPTACTVTGLVTELIETSEKSP